MILIFGAFLAGALSLAVALLVGLTYLLRHFFGSIGAGIGTACLFCFGIFLVRWTLDTLRTSTPGSGADAEFLGKWFAYATGVPAAFCFVAALFMLRLVFKAS